MKKNDSLKPFFVQRLGAFIFDIIIVSLIASIFCSFFIDAQSITKLNQSMTEVSNKYMQQEIDVNTFLTESESISYQLAQKQGIVILINLLFTILYFIVYQFYNEGQTLGKKIFKIKVVRKDHKELTMNNFIFRSLFINSILINMIVLALSIFGNSKIYFYGKLSCELIDSLIVIISIFMIMWSKNGRGVHDYIANTMVIKDLEVKENVLCEN